MLKYGLRHKASGLLLIAEVRSNGEHEFCGSTETTLTHGGDGEPAWMVPTPEHAEYVRQFSTEWYNSGYDTPGHPYEPEELEVVEIEVITRADPVNVVIPTPEEYFREKMKTDRGHEYNLKMYLEMKPRERRKFHYSLYDLLQFMDLFPRKSK